MQPKTKIYIITTGISFSIPFFLSLFYSLPDLGRYYYIISAANILSSIMSLGSVFSIYASGITKTNMLLRAAGCIFLCKIFLNDDFVLMASIMMLLEKVVTANFYYESKNHYLMAILCGVSLISVVALSLISCKVELIALARIAPFTPLVVLYFAKIKHSLFSKRITSKTEIFYFVNESIQLTLDSGFIFLLGVMCKSNITGTAGFSRTCSSPCFILYNWKIVNLKDYNFNLNNNILLYFLSIAVGLLLFIIRFRKPTILSLLFICYFCLLPFLSSLILSKIKKLHKN